MNYVDIVPKTQKDVDTQLVPEAKGQLISKAKSKLFIWTKKNWKYFCIFALVSKSGQIKKYKINIW